MRRALALGALLAGAACPPHGEVIPVIHVDPRAAGRLDWIARRTPAKDAPAGARVHVMAPGEELGGPNVLGRPGDLVIENGEVVFVIDQLGAGTGFAEGGGNIVDAADAHARRDELGQMFTYLGKFPRQGVYDRLTSGVDPDGTAWIEAKGHDLDLPTIAVTTRYTLHPPDRALLLETTLSNGGAAEVTLPGVGDAIEWGGAMKTAPGMPDGFTGSSRGPYVGAVGRFTSYAIASTEGDIEGVSGHSWTDTTQQAPVKLAPAQSARYARIFVVGPRPDTSSLVGELALAAGAPVGEVDAVLPDAGALPTGFKASLVAEGATDALTLAPPFSGSVPVGRYRLRGLGSAPDGGAFDVSVGAVARPPVVLDAAAAFDARCVDEGGAPLPCKVTFEGQDPTATPAFGVADAAGPARNQVTTATGEAHVELAAGHYRIFASRGPEYSLASVDVVLAPGEHAAGTLAVARVLDTRGYLACDFHQHTMRSLDSGVAMRDRVVADVAEGVEIAVASEHNVASDLEPIVRELHLDREMVSLPGDELTSDALASPWGHANVYPLTVDATRPRGGSPDLKGGTAHTTFDEVRRTYGDVVLQVNHPRGGHNGYFDLLGFDPKTGLGTAPGYDPAFDALEVWNGRNVVARARVLEDFLALLRVKRTVTPVADTDTHGVVGQEAGYPRTYVRVADDAHLDAWDAARSADLVRGIKVLRDVVLTNGPMLRVRVDGVGIGGVVRTARGRAVHVAVTVESAPWIEVDEVSLVRASGAPVEKKKISEKMAGNVLRAAVSFDFVAADDDALVVVASGTRTLSPVLAETESQTAQAGLARLASEITPWAMTGSIQIAVDNGGRSLSIRSR